MEEARNDSSLAVGQSYKQKREVILEARRDKKKVHFATLIDICHLKNAEFDMVNDGSGAYVVFTERGSSASQIDCCKSDGRHCESTRIRWTSRRRSISLHPGKNGGRIKDA